MSEARTKLSPMSHALRGVAGGCGFVCLWILRPDGVAPTHYYITLQATLIVALFVPVVVGFVVSAGAWWRSRSAVMAIWTVALFVELQILVALMVGWVVRVVDVG